jgi:hypothetical protein
MSIQTRIDNLIDQNNWKTIEDLLKDQHGCIGKNGGRYSYDPRNFEFNGTFDINKICWRVFDATANEAFWKSDKELAAIPNIIKELRRIYDETETALDDASFVAYIATRVYDFNEMLLDGYPPIQHLENDTDILDVHFYLLAQKV